MRSVSGPKNRGQDTKIQINLQLAATCIGDILKLQKQTSLTHDSDHASYEIKSSSTLALKSTSTKKSNSTKSVDRGRDLMLLIGRQIAHTRRVAGERQPRLSPISQKAGVSRN